MIHDHSHLAAMTAGLDALDRAYGEKDSARKQKQRDAWHEAWEAVGFAIDALISAVGALPIGPRRKRLLVVKCKVLRLLLDHFQWEGRS
jgi:hypothetical protein